MRGSYEVSDYVSPVRDRSSHWLLGKAAGDLSLVEVARDSNDGLLHLTQSTNVLLHILRFDFDCFQNSAGKFLVKRLSEDFKVVTLNGLLEDFEVLGIENHDGVFVGDENHLILLDELDKRYLKVFEYEGIGLDPLIFQLYLIAFIVKLFYLLQSEEYNLVCEGAYQN